MRPQNLRLDLSPPAGTPQPSQTATMPVSQRPKLPYSRSQSRHGSNSNPRVPQLPTRQPTMPSGTTPFPSLPGHDRPAQQSTSYITPYHSDSSDNESGRSGSNYRRNRGPSDPINIPQSTSRGRGYTTYISGPPPYSAVQTNMSCQKCQAPLSARPVAVIDRGTAPPQHAQDFLTSQMASMSVGTGLCDECALEHSGYGTQGISTFGYDNKEYAGMMSTVIGGGDERQSRSRGRN